MRRMTAVALLLAASSPSLLAAAKNNPNVAGDASRYGKKFSNENVNDDLAQWKRAGVPEAIIQSALDCKVQ
ncbi:MAG TPA: hypothetical protein VNB06_06420 [Thermoanaerobaculia bacterium]|nr:hypothetical protein [Thermoanaerobaculia bacterium]